MSDTSPQVWVGTYSAYNNGSLKGKWFDLATYGDKEEFLEACQEFHGPGEHEFMFSDHMNIPARFISESSISDDTWEEWVDLDEDDRELLEVYLDEVDSRGDLDKAREAFNGKFSSEEDWAAQFWEDCGMLAEIPAHAQNYIDYASYARDCRLGGDMTFVSKGGEVWAFSNNV